jgi:hypothetical protein
LQKIEILFKQKGIDNPEKERKAKMSNQMSMQKQSIAKPFCKVCHDAGKTVAEYSTHYVRESRGGAVVCPTILNQQCKYCKKHGHTPSHCPALQAKQVQAKQVQAKQVQAKQVQAHEAKQVQAHEAKQVQAKQVQAQAQARLCEPPRIENKISAPVIKPVALKMNSWASVVGKKPGQAQEQAQEEQAQEEQAQEQAQEEPEEEQAKAPEEEQAQRVPEEQAQEQAQRVPEQAQRVPEAQAQAQEQAQRVPEEQAPAFNYSNMDWADVE